MTLPGVFVQVRKVAWLTCRLYIGLSLHWFVRYVVRRFTSKFDINEKVNLACDALDPISTSQRLKLFFVAKLLRKELY